MQWHSWGGYKATGCVGSLTAVCKGSLIDKAMLGSGSKTEAWNGSEGKGMLSHCNEVPCQT